MASTKLIIRSDRKTFGKTTIYVQYTHKSAKKKFSTGFSIEPERWNSESGKAIGSSPEVVNFNAALNVKKRRIDKIIQDAILSDEEPSFSLVEQRLKKLTTGITETNSETGFIESKTPDFLALFSSYIEKTSATKAHGTVKHYKSTLAHLENYTKKRNTTLTLEKIDINFYYDFIKYLTQDLNLNNGTANNQLKRVKCVMGYAVDNDLTENLKFKKFKLLKYIEPDVIYLTQDELQFLYEYDLSKIPRLEKVRDLLVLGCTTGLRYSDFSKVGPANIEQDQITLNMRKRTEWLRVNLNQYSRTIISRYPEGMPTISLTKFNLYLKELGKYCGIDKPTLMVHYSGTTRVENIVPKYSLLTSHTCRRTFATQSAERGMGIEVLQKFTAHSNTKSLMRYMQVSDESKKNQMSKAWD